MLRFLPFSPRFFVAATFVLLLACTAVASIAEAKAKKSENSMSFIRDAEIEHYLHELGSPIFKAASLDPGSVSIMIIQNSDLNAFVAGGMNIFFYTGLLQAAETPEQLQGVLAHETGHIAGGHIIRGRQAMDQASAQAIIGMLVATAAGMATGRGDVTVGAISGAQHIAERNLLSFSRAQESSADAAAMRFLDDSNLSSKGLYEFMQKLAVQDVMPLDQQSEYARTHPLSQSRVQNISQHLQDRPKLEGRNLAESFKKKHDRMKAKLLGFMQPETALLRYTDKDPRASARYARAIALYRKSQLSRALSLMDSLIMEEPNDPFYIEMKAQMLFENGKIKEASELYKRALEMTSDSPLIRISYAHTLLERRDPTLLDEAVFHLLEANRLEARNPDTWRLLAAAWSRQGEIKKSDDYQGLVSYALAEESVAEGNDKAAKEYADRALGKLVKGTPYWLRAQDIKISVARHHKD